MDLIAQGLAPDGWRPADWLALASVLLAAATVAANVVAERWRRQDSAADRAAQERERRAADLAAWRDRSVDALVAARQVLARVVPSAAVRDFEQGLLNAEDLDSIVDDLEARRNRANELLIEVASGHPSSRVRALADEARSSLSMYSDETCAVLVLTKWDDTDPALEPAEDLRTQASGVVEQLTDAMHSDPAAPTS